MEEQPLTRRQEKRYKKLELLKNRIKLRKEEVTAEEERSEVVKRLKALSKPSIVYKFVMAFNKTAVDYAKWVAQNNFELEKIIREDHKKMESEEQNNGVVVLDLREQEQNQDNDVIDFEKDFQIPGLTC